MKRLFLITTTAALLLLGTPTPAREAASFSISMTPTGFVTKLPFEVIITVVVPKSEDNRALTVELSSDDYWRGSQEELDGARAAVTHSYRYRNVGAGEFVGIATLEFLKAGRCCTERSIKSQTLTVLQ